MQFCKDLTNQLHNYKKEKENILKRIEKRREKKLRGPSPAVNAGEKLTAQISRLKEKIKEETQDNKNPSQNAEPPKPDVGLNTNLFDMLVSDDSIVEVNTSEAISTPKSNEPTSIDDDEHDYELINQLDEEWEKNSVYDRINRFVEEIAVYIEANPAFRDASSDLIQAARDGFEKMVIIKFKEETIFAIRAEYKLEDVSLYNRAWDLSFITPKELEFKPEYIRKEMVDGAVNELRRLDYQASPSEQLDCIVEASRIVGTMISLAAKDANGADDFLPAFIYVLIQAKVAYAKSTIDFIEKIRGPSALRAKYIFIYLVMDIALQHSVVQYLLLNKLMHNY